MSATATTPASHPRLDRLVAQAIARAGSTPGALAMVYPCDALAMDAAARILDSGMARPVLIGPADLIAQAAGQAGVDVRRFEVVDTGAHAHGRDHHQVHHLLYVRLPLRHPRAFA